MSGCAPAASWVVLGGFKVGPMSTAAAQRQGRSCARQYGPHRVLVVCIAGLRLGGSGGVCRGGMAVDAVAVPRLGLAYA